jgi:hypothetical protein
MQTAGVGTRALQRYSTTKRQVEEGRRLQVRATVGREGRPAGE